MIAVMMSGSAGLAVRPRTGIATERATQGAPAPKTQASGDKLGSPVGPPRIGCSKCDGSPLQIVNTGGGMCLDADSGGLNKDGGKVQVWTCVSFYTEAQTWRFQKTKTVNGIEMGRIVNDGGKKCLDVDKPMMFKNGTPLQVWNCSDVPEQLWYFRGTEIVNEGSQKCLAVDRPNMNKVGAVVQVWDCNREPQQQWNTR
jgi:hypothetical protein